MKVTILGAGAFGLALAGVCSENGYDVVAWDIDKEKCYEYQKNRITPMFNDYIIPDNINFTDDIKDAIKKSSLIIIAVPTQFVRDVVKNMPPILSYQHICLTSKGIEKNTCLFSSDILKEKYRTRRIAVLSGPSFASDIVNGATAILSLATKSRETNRLVKDILQNKRFKLMTTKDIKGVEAFGAAKNIMAIGAGMLEGQGLSATTKSSYFNSSLHDTKTLVKALGGDKKTMNSPAGVGDMHLTCGDKQSRNFNYGYLLGKNSSEEEIIEYVNNTTIEGLYTLKSIRKLITNLDINIPIFDILQGIVSGTNKIDDILEYLGTQNGPDIFGYVKKIK